MRGLQLPLTQTQNIRLQRALEKLESLSLKANSNVSVTVADTIPVDQNDGFLKGHGTLDVDGEVIATVCGVVERINKLVYVRTLRARYKPEVGDIVVGRVIEVVPKRWKLSINYSQDAILMLSSINLPDGIQRRRTAEDETCGLFFKRMMSYVPKNGVCSMMGYTSRQEVRNMGSSLAGYCFQFLLFW